jgi:hypothetical protein
MIITEKYLLPSMIVVFRFRHVDSPYQGIRQPRSVQVCDMTPNRSSLPQEASAIVAC